MSCASPSLSRAMRLVVASSRLFSFLPFSISQKSKNPNTYVFKATIAGFVSSICKAIIEISLAYVLFTTLFNVYQHHKSVTNLFLVIIYSMANVLAAIHEIYDAFGQKQVVEVLNDLQFVDDELAALNIFPKNKNILTIAAGLEFFIASIWVALASMHEIIFKDTILLWIGFVLPYLIMCISTFHFLGLVMLISQRFKVLNENWQELVRYMNGLNKIGISTPGCDVFLGIEYRLHVFQRLRETLVQISEKVNNAYSVQLLMMFTTYFAVFVQKVHRVTIIRNDTHLTLENTVYVSLWLSTIALIFITVCWTCTTCIYHANNTPKILLTLDLEFQDNCMRIYYTQFLIQLLHSKVDFNVCGLFSIRLPLLLEMATTVAGYIVVCIQFSWD